MPTKWSAAEWQSSSWISPRAFHLSHDGLTDRVTVAIAVLSLMLLFVTEIDTLWIILGAAVISLSASSVGILSQIDGGTPNRRENQNRNDNRPGNGPHQVAYS
jgi:hypothetical protein